MLRENDAESVPDEPGHKYDFSTVARDNGTPRDHLAKMLPAVLAEVMWSTFDEGH